MLKRTGIILLLVLAAPAGMAFADSLTAEGQPCPPECVTDSMEIVTWYPSPYNEYEELRLYPISVSNSECNDYNRGLMYYDSDDDKIRVCKGTLLDWQELGYWQLSGTGVDIYNTNSGKVGIGIGTTDPLSKLDIRGTNAKTIVAPFEDILNLASTDSINPLTLRAGIKTAAIAVNRYGAIEVDDAGTKRDLVLQPTGGNVGIGTTKPGTYDSENVKLDIGNSAGNGYMAVDDVYLKNPKNGNPRWASESIDLSIQTFSVGCSVNLDFGRWHFCYVSNVKHNDEGDDSDFIKQVYYDNDPDVEQKRTWHGYAGCSNDRAGFDAICINLF